MRKKEQRPPLYIYIYILDDEIEKIIKNDVKKKVNSVNFQNS